jgi:outer membrane protein insertion porin family
VAAAQQNLIEEIVIHGNRRIPADTIRSRIFTRPGDALDTQAIERDVHSLWNSNYFEDIRVEREESPKGVRLHIYVKERPTIRQIEYPGLSSVSQSDIAERFKERKLGLTPESQYDPTKVKRAEVLLKELLAERGRQFAEIRTEARQIPPAAVRLSFNVKEGPKVKVGKIQFEGNKALSDRVLRRAMKNLKPIGIPRSIFLENLFSKTFNASKLSEDVERARMAYQDKGYFKALLMDPKTEMRDVGRGGFRIPLIMRGRGKRVDITIPVEEGDRYKLGSITFKGNKAVQNTAALRAQFPIRDGDWFNRTSIVKGLDNLRKLYGEGGYINYTAVPDTRFDEERKLIHLEMDIDEGKQYFVRRIEFQGNTTTRDKVIRRELPIDEGSVYNSKRWELGVLRLNQLNYFEKLDHEKDTDIKKYDNEATIDLTLKVKEKGKNSIGLTGGVSGLAGSFIGINYETNNFLGLGETLRIEANVGDRERNILFGFTEPYLLDRPIQFGFTVFSRKYDFDQARFNEILFGRELDLSESQLNFLQNYTQSSTGFTVSTSYALRRSFSRVGLTYAFDTSSVQVFSDASRRLFEFLAFRGVSGPSALEGVITSKILPSYSFNTVDHFFRPSGGHSLYLGGEISGLGGNVKAIRPIVEYKRFQTVNRNQHVVGFRIQSSFLTGYGGRVAPPFERFYLGGDNDIRGFDIRSVSPMAFLVDKANIPLTNPDGSTILTDPSNPRSAPVTVPIPVRRLVFPGGDTSFVGNLEYRIPIAGPVTLAAFVDTGMSFIARRSQLRITETLLNDLNSTIFGCPIFDPINNRCSGGTPQPFAAELETLADTNYQPRMSTGLELQVLMPIINAPFRLYWAYNPLRLNTFASTPHPIAREMFPAGGAGDFTFRQALSQFAPDYRLQEPTRTFRFSVSTTF